MVSAGIIFPTKDITGDILFSLLKEMPINYNKHLDIAGVITQSLSNRSKHSICWRQFSDTDDTCEQVFIASENSFIYSE